MLQDAPEGTRREGLPVPTAAPATGKPPVSFTKMARGGGAVAAVVAFFAMCVKLSCGASGSAPLLCGDASAHGVLSPLSIKIKAKKSHKYIYKKINNNKNNHIPVFKSSKFTLTRLKVAFIEIH